MAVCCDERVKMRFKNDDLLAGIDGEACDSIVVTGLRYGIASSTTELLRVVPPYVSAVDDPVFELQSILFALLDILLVQVLAAMKLFGVLAPLPDSMYKLGHIFPKPI
jgi:hypothetical protein